LEIQDEERPATGERWQHQNRRNEPHQSTGKFAGLEAEREDIDVRLVIIRNQPYPNCAKDKRKLEKRRRHLVRKLGERGESHSIIDKGFVLPA
jgi:hypothetical protein